MAGPSVLSDRSGSDRAAAGAALITVIQNEASDSACPIAQVYALRGNASPRADSRFEAKYAPERLAGLLGRVMSAARVPGLVNASQTSPFDPAVGSSFFEGE